MKSYSELSKLKTFEERFKYLELNRKRFNDTFGELRYVNQSLYSSNRWRKTRDKVIIRDMGCDLGVPGHDIYGRIEVHHINPLTMEDIVEGKRCVFDPENLICVSKRTHDAIHYQDQRVLAKPNERRPNDTCPWRC